VLGVAGEEEKERGASSCTRERENRHNSLKRGVWSSVMDWHGGENGEGDMTSVSHMQHSINQFKNNYDWI
jgi:hypothetical protein